MSHQRIAVDGKEFNVIGLQIVPWLPFNPAAALSTDLPVIATCRFDVSGRYPGNDGAFSFFGLEAIDRENWPPTIFRTPAQPQADKKRPQVIDMANW